MSSVEVGLCCQATPREVLIGELMDSNVPKSEREHAAVAEIARLTDELEKCTEDAGRMRTELVRAYRALAAYTHARDHGQPLPDHAVAYHSLTEAAAKRFVNHGALDGSEYFIGKSVDVLHAALRGESEGSRSKP